MIERLKQEANAALVNNALTALDAAWAAVTAAVDARDAALAAWDESRRLKTGKLK